MGTYLNPGNDGFQMIRKGNYVDKTGMIDIINSRLGTPERFTCVSRPRRFGKSFAAKMLCAYYDKSCDSKTLFSGLKISRKKSFLEHLNRYNVLYLDITWFIANVRDKKDTVSYLQKIVLSELYAIYPSVCPVDETLPMMLSAIARTTGEKFIVIIDEWDALFREQKDDDELQKSYIELLRGLFKSQETDRMIEAAYITGILPIKKYGKQSALSDFLEYTMVQPEPMEEYVGFTEREVKDLCENTELDFEKFKFWYDGYVLGDGVHIYNPKSVMEAVMRKRLRNYWTQTETYESLKMYIDLNEDGLKEAVVQMLGGAHIPIVTETFQNDMVHINSKDDVLTLLVHLGYLAYDSEKQTVYIPNKELQQEFIRTVKVGKHREVAKLIASSDRLLEDTLNMKEEKVAEAIQKAHRIGTAPLYYNNEQALRSVIRAAYYSAVDEYQEIQELPSGKGYADVVFLPVKGSDKPALLIELKWNKTADGAILQIKEKRYPEILERLATEILLVGINYDEKTQVHTCTIEKYEKNESY